MSIHTVTPDRPFLLNALPGDICLPILVHGCPIERVTLPDGQLLLVVESNFLCSRTNARSFDIYRASTGERLGVQVLVKSRRGSEYLSCAAAAKSWYRIEDAVKGLAEWAAERWAELDARRAPLPARVQVQAVAR